MTHPLILRATGNDTRWDATWHDMRAHNSLTSYHSDFGGVTMPEFLEAAQEVRNKLESGARLGIKERVDLTADWVDLLELAKRAGGDKVPCYAVVSTYDPKGSFSPGRRVTWSGHLNRREAEKALARWITHLNRPLDPMVVEENWPTTISNIRANGWKGPHR